MKYEFGVKAKDTITGYSSYITGCDQYLIQPSVDEKGAKRDAIWYDEKRLKILADPKVVLGEERTPENGACGEAPMK